MEHRKRRTKLKQTKRQKQVDCISDDKKDAGKVNFSIFRLLLRDKILFLIAFILIFVLLNILWPTPRFSTYVQYWKDSGYHFKYKNHNIFYQNIFLIPKKVKHFRREPVLLIIHGFPTSSFDWNHLVEDLHVKFPRIIIPDLLGLGFSDKPSTHDYTVMEQATIIEELLFSLNVSEAHILAHDLGDSVSQELLARYQDKEYDLSFRIKSLCLTNGGIIPSQHQPRPVQKLFLLPYVSSILSPLMNRFIFNMRFSKVFGPSTQPTSEELYNIYSIFSFNNGHNSFAKVLKYINERYQNEDRWVGALKETLLPLHLIYGPMDPVNTPDGFLKYYKEHIQHSTVHVLDNIGHYPQTEDPKNFIKAYFDFLHRVVNDYYVL